MALRMSLVSLSWNCKRKKSRYADKHYYRELEHDWAVTGVILLFSKDESN